MLTKFARSTLLLLGVMASLLACSEPPPSATRNGADTATSANGAIEVIDFQGQTVRLSKPAQRIVTLAPHIVENAYTAGAGAQLVGAVEWSNYPEQAKQLAIVGGFQKINYERILQLKPDLVIAWKTGNSHASVTKLKELGLTVYLDQADSLEGIAKSIRDIGVLSGHTAHASAAAEQYLAQLNEYRKRYAAAPKLSVFYQVWNSPLQSINGNHIISDAIEICGGENIYADANAIAPMINIESVLERDPSVIIASGVSDQPPAYLEDWHKFPSLTAVKQDNLFFVNPDHLQRHTVRILLGLKETCRHLDQARAKTKHSPA